MNPTPDAISEVTIDGQSLTTEQVVAVARFRARVNLHPHAERRVRLARHVVDTLVSAGAKVYGLTTGFGSKRDTSIPLDELAQLQLNLIRSHACGVGPALAEDEVRAAMLLRANTLARGNSGIRVEVLTALLAFLNRDVYPWIPSRGSLGASGDLAPLSHLALALVNDPHAKFYQRDPGEPASQAPTASEKRPDYVAKPADWRFGPAPDNLFGDAGLEPVVLKAKEGLALNNGTQVSTAIGLLTAFDAQVLLESAELVCALSLEASKGVRNALDPRLHEARPVVGQQETAARIRRFTEESEILQIPVNTARLHRAERALDAVREVLPETGASDLQGLIDQVDAVQKETQSFVQDLCRLIPKDGDQSKSYRDYREELRPLRASFAKLYMSILEVSLSGEELKSRDFMADAVQQLQLALPEAPAVQDDYSFRCTPQVLGTVRKVIGDALVTLQIESNSATDNPLIFPPGADTFSGTADDFAESLTVEACREAVVSGGNFHGEAVAITMDHLAIALSELASISERRTAHLVDGSLSNGLPSLLVEDSGLNSGLMIPQYVAAGLVSENKVLAHPASVDSIPTCENTEDHVSMSPIAAIKARQVLGNAEAVVAIELLTAWQGLRFRSPLRAGLGTQMLWDKLESGGLTPVVKDRVLYRDMDWVRKQVRSGIVWQVARAAGE